MLRPSRTNILHCWRRRSGANFYHRQLAAVDAVIVNFGRRFFPLKSSRKGLTAPVFLAELRIILRSILVFVFLALQMSCNARLASPPRYVTLTPT